MLAAAAHEYLEGLATGRLRYVWGGRHIPTRVTRAQRQRYAEACELGYLITRAGDSALRALWARRADVLEMPDVVVRERPTSWLVTYDLLQAGRHFGPAALASLSRWAPRFGRARIHELTGDARCTSLDAAQTLARLIVDTFATGAEPRQGGQ